MRFREATIVYRKTADRMPPTIVSSRDVHTLATTMIPDGPAERFCCIALDARNRPLGWNLIAVGGVATCNVEVAACFRYAIMTGAVAIILVHNHPSGEVEPSQDDRDITARIKQAGELIGVKVLDSVIISPDRHYSFLDHGEL